MLLTLIKIKLDYTSIQLKNHHVSILIFKYGKTAVTRSPCVLLWETLEWRPDVLCGQVCESEKSGDIAGVRE